MSRMRPGILLLSFAFFVTPFASLQAQDAPSDRSYRASEADRQALLSVREAVWRAFYRNDADALRTMIPPSLIAINPGDAHWQSRDEFIAAAQEFANHHGQLVSLKFPKTEIQIFGETAVLFSLYEVHFQFDGKPQVLSGRSSEVFHREQGHWFNTGWHLDSFEK